MTYTTLCGHEFKRKSEGMHHERGCAACQRKRTRLVVDADFPAEKSYAASICAGVPEFEFPETQPAYERK